MALSRTIVIAGAGIGGMTAALTLATRGFRVILLEKAERLEQAGAGLQLSPNASRVLVELGLQPGLAVRATLPDAVSLMSARHGGEVMRLPLGEAAAFKAGAPYWVLHRADLQAELLARVQAHPDVDLRLGHQFEDFGIHPNGIVVGERRDNKREHEPAQALIGADGVWSAVRHQLFPAIQPHFSGLIAWRGTFDADRLPRELAPRRVQLWMGAHAHLVAYPISGGRQINVVAIMSGRWNRPGWSSPGDASEIKNYFAAARWPSHARMVLGAVDDWRRWALFTLPDGGVWSKGPVALLGDASHAMLPFAAQGAGMAIEDAAVLAACLAPFANNTANIATGLQRYGAMRRGRVSRVQRLARQSGKIYHMRWPMALARDVVIRTLGATRLQTRQDWLYDWRI